MIITCPFDYQKYKRIEKEDYRFYDVGGDRPLPSVTTILDKTTDKTFLNEWRSKVGEIEADKICSTSSMVGNFLHDNLENYILGRHEIKGPPISKLMTKSIIANGLVDVSEVWGTEIMLFYPGLYAGTSDLVGIYKEKPTIIDYKNSRSVKKSEWITSYYMQLVAYAMAHNELYGTDIKNGVIFMATMDGKFLKFELKEDKFNYYWDEWLVLVEKFYNTNDNIL